MHLKEWVVYQAVVIESAGEKEEFERIKEAIWEQVGPTGWLSFGAIRNRQGRSGQFSYAHFPLPIWPISSKPVSGQNSDRLLDTSAFIGTNATDGPIPSNLPAIKPHRHLTNADDRVMPL